MSDLGPSPQESLSTSCKTEAVVVDFTSLIGERLLDGVDFETAQIKRYDWDDYFTDCQTMRFRLDGVIYCAIEDPSDGYRSSMDKLVISEGEMRNTFTPQRVLARMKPDGNEWGGSQKNDTLQLLDMVTGKVVLEAGTDNTDDYYPSFVGTFHPENMAINSTTPPIAIAAADANTTHQDKQT